MLSRRGKIAKNRATLGLTQQQQTQQQTQDVGSSTNTQQSSQRNLPIYKKKDVEIAKVESTSSSDELFSASDTSLSPKQLLKTPETKVTHHSPGLQISSLSLEVKQEPRIGDNGNEKSKVVQEQVFLPSPPTSILTEEDVNNLLGLPKLKEESDKKHREASIKHDSSSDSSLENVTRRRKVLNRKYIRNSHSKSRNIIEDSDSDSDNNNRDEQNKSSQSFLSDDSIVKDHDWVTEIQTSLGRGESVIGVAPQLIRNTVKLFRSCDTEKLATGLQISSDKLTAIIELLDMTADSIQNEPFTMPPPPPQNKSVSEMVKTNSQHSSGSQAYSTPLTKEQLLASTPGLKSTFKLEFDDSELPDVSAEHLSTSYSGARNNNNDYSVSSRVNENTNYTTGKEVTQPSFKYNQTTTTPNTRVSLSNNRDSNYSLPSTSSSLPNNNNYYSNNNNTSTSANYGDNDNFEDYQMDEGEGPPSSSSYFRTDSHSEFWNNEVTAPPKPLGQSYSSYSPEPSASSSTPAVNKNKLASTPAIQSNFELDFDMEDFPDSEGFDRNGTVNLASDSDYGDFSTRDNTPSSSFPRYEYDELPSPFPSPTKASSPLKGSRLNTSAALSPSSKLNISAGSTDMNNLEIGKFRGNIVNDGISGKFDGNKFEFSKQMLSVFRNKFGLFSFRPNQLQTVNAAMMGEDCFVLMPTGGGKSLCYQLTALITPGVTIVISPLKSLILDQVQRLLSLDIEAAHLSGDVSVSEQNEIYRKLAMKPPSIRLLYVTPEKLSASQRMIDVLQTLYDNRLLARFVIDEAHCVSQWGHDFRPDYTKLGVLKAKFPRVPTMALTATATPRVRLDILNQLGIQKCKWFLCSFNRPNLKYEVRPKKGKAKALEDVVAVLQTKRFKGQSGIIYCFSRNDCDQTASQLGGFGIKAIAYHAGLSDKQRAEVQNAWLNDRVKIICATIAFGMGIDKPDVRFVIHYSLPKSVEGYYQESGRAGRDGDPAICILFFSYQDVVRVRRMIEMDKSPGSFQAKKTHIENLNRMISYCENKTDCRRAQQLEYFGEIFNKALCKQNRITVCDNCSANINYKEVDVTELCQAIITAVRFHSNGRRAKGQASFTLLHFLDVFRGSQSAKIRQAGHDSIALNGKGKSWTKMEAERLFRKLVADGYLKEEIIVTKDDNAIAYLRVNDPKSLELERGKVKYMFPMTPTISSLSVKETANDVNIGLESDVAKLQEDCKRELIAECRKIAESLNLHNFTSVMSVQTLTSLSCEMPITPEAMLNVPGVTRANMEKYGARLLEIIVKFAAEKDTLITESEMANANIDDYDVPVPSTSKAKPTGKAAVIRRNGTQNNDGWINVDDRGSSSYFTGSPSRKKKTATRKPNRGFWKGKGKSKSTWKKPAAGKRKSSVAGFTPQKASTSRSKPTATTSAASKSSTSAGLSGYLLPPPQPKKMKF